jgi:protocatechuate 3,4-dioxygenase beta subunit
MCDSIRRLALFSLIFLMVIFLASCSSGTADDLPATGAQLSPSACEPTRADMLGPFYEPGAPLRDRVGEGYRLSGTVRAAADCAAVENALVELWMAGPDGRYSDDYRAAIFSGPEGEYQFESHFPPPYAGRPSHIHLRVTAPGFAELVTQHYPEQGSQDAVFDLVLRQE